MISILQRRLHNLIADKNPPGPSPARFGRWQRRLQPTGLALVANIIVACFYGAPAAGVLVVLMLATGGAP